MDGRMDSERQLGIYQVADWGYGTPKYGQVQLDNRRALDRGWRLELANEELWERVSKQDHGLEGAVWPIWRQQKEAEGPVKGLQVKGWRIWEASAAVAQRNGGIRGVQLQL